LLLDAFEALETCPRRLGRDVSSDGNTKNRSGLVDSVETRVLYFSASSSLAFFLMLRLRLRRPGHRCSDLSVASQPSKSAEIVRTSPPLLQKVTSMLCVSLSHLASAVANHVHLQLLEGFCWRSIGLEHPMQIQVSRRRSMASTTMPAGTYPL